MLLSGGDELLLERIDLATLTYSDVDGTITSGEVTRNTVVPPDVLNRGELYRIGYRFSSSAPNENVDVLLTDVQPRFIGPEADVALTFGDIDDGIVNFGPDSDGTTTAELLVEATSDQALTIESAELIGEGFSFVNPNPGQVVVQQGIPMVYRVRTLDRSRAANATLRIKTDDPNRSFIEIPLQHDGSIELDDTATSDPDPIANGPVIDSIPDRVLVEGDLLSLDVLADDPTPGDGLIYQLNNGPAFSSIDEATGMITWDPPEQYLGGIYSFSVQATEPTNDALTHSRSLDVTFEKTNRSPTIEAVAKQVVRQGELLTVLVDANDHDFPAQELTYAVGSDAPEGVAIDSATGRLEWQTDQDTAPGTYEVPLLVQDDDVTPATAQLSFLVEVIDVNVSPVIAALPLQMGVEGQELTFTVMASDADGDESMLRLGSPIPEGVSLDEDTGIVTWTPGESDGGQTRVIPVEAVDGRDPALVFRQEFEVEVAEVNSPPTLDVPSMIEVAVGERIELDLNSTDLESSTDLLRTVLADGAPEEATIFADTFIWVPDAEGQFTITFETADFREPRVDVTHTLVINVVPEVIPPELTILSPTGQSIPSIFGRVVDDSDIASLQVRLANPAGEFSDILALSDENGFFEIDQATLESAFGGAIVPETTYELEFRAEDAGGAASTVSHDLRLDITAPPQPTVMLLVEFDTAPVGDGITSEDVVDVLITTEPFASLALTSGDLQTADENGEIMLSGLPLTIGRNDLGVISDSAGNTTVIDSYLVRDSGGSIGPDPLGFFAESVTPTFVDISSNGQLLIQDVSTDFGSLTPTDLGDFRFDHLGVEYTGATVHPNGWIQLVSADSFDFPEIEPFRFETNYVDSVGRGIYWDIADVTGGRELTIQWDVDADIATESGTIKRPLIFQAVLNSGANEIQFNYQDLSRDDVDWANIVTGVDHQLLFGNEVLKFQIASNNGPFDLVDDDVSVRISQQPDTFPPLMDGYGEETIRDLAFLANIAIEVIDASDFTVTGTLDRPGATEVDLTSFLSAGIVSGITTEAFEQMNGGPLADGSYKMIVKATDVHGNEAETSVEFNLGLTPPELLSFDLTSSSDSLPFGDLITDSDLVDLQGTTEPGATVTVTGTFGSETTTADENGVFVIEDQFSPNKLIPLEIGDNDFTVTINNGFQFSDTEVSVERIMSDPVMPGTIVGPDPFGYWARATTPSFDDIFDIGNLAFRDVDEGVEFLGPDEIDAFEFRFYGELHNQFIIHPNGGIELGDEDEAAFGFDVDFDFDFPVIAPFGEDLIVPDDASSGVHWQVLDDAGDSKLVVQWTNVEHQSTGQRLTFQLVLNSADHSIQFNYHPTDFVGIDIDRSSVGIRDGIEQPLDPETDDPIDARFIELIPQLAETSRLVQPGVSVLITADFPTPGAPQIRSASEATAVEISEWRVEFDRAMNTDSFSIADDIASLIGPSGDLTSEITGFVWENPQTLVVSLTPQTADGQYVFTLNPSVMSAFDGTAIDQDGDGIPEEDPDDVFTLTTEIRRCTDVAPSGYQACVVDANPSLLTETTPGVFVIVDNTEDGFRSVDLGNHSFRFHDEIASGDGSLFVSTNGYITLGRGSTIATAADGRSPDSATIAALWDDWNTTSRQVSVVLGQLRDSNDDGIADELVVQWTEVVRPFATGRATFQAVLQLDTGIAHGDIHFHYFATDLNSITAVETSTVGVKTDDAAWQESLVVSNPEMPEPTMIDAGRSVTIHQTRETAWLRFPGEEPTIDPATTVDLSFSGPVSGISLSNLTLTRDAQSIDLATAATLSGSDTDFQLDLGDLAQVPGEYVLRFDSVVAGRSQLSWALFTSDLLPTDIVLSNLNVPENQPGAIIGSLEAQGLGDGRTVFWSTSDSRFEVVDGNLQVSGAAILDFEQENIVPIEITATSSERPDLSISKRIDLVVEDGSDVPSNVLFAGGEVLERISGINLGSIVVLDQDSGDEHSVTVVGDDRYLIDDGLLRLGEEIFFDGETSVSLEVVATDPAGGEVRGNLLLSIRPNPFPWHFDGNPLDINRDTRISALDALIAINYLARSNANGNTELPRARSADSNLGYFDTNRDGDATAADALRVVNFLARNSVMEPEQIVEFHSPDSRSVGSLSELRESVNDTSSHEELDYEAFGRDVVIEQRRYGIPSDTVPSDANSSLLFHDTYFSELGEYEVQDEVDVEPLSLLDGRSMMRI